MPNDKTIELNYNSENIENYIETLAECYKVLLKLKSQSNKTKAALMDAKCLDVLTLKVLLNEVCALSHGLFDPIPPLSA